MKLSFTAIGTIIHLVAGAQSPQVYTTSPNDSCATSLSLYSNASYFLSLGCQAAPQVSFGYYTSKKDSISLQPFDINITTVTKKIEATYIPGDSIWVRLFDVNGVNITAKISVGLEVPGRGSYMFSSDTSGQQKFVYRRAGGKIVLRTLNKLFGQRFEVDAGAGNSLDIMLNLQGNWIQSSHAVLKPVGKLRFLKKGSGLVSRPTPLISLPVLERKVLL